MSRQLLVLVLAVLSSGVSCTRYEHTDKAVAADVTTQVVVPFQEKFSYVGRHFFNITVVPRWGCIAFGQNNADLNNADLSYESVLEYELVCPLFSEHRNEESSYSFFYEEFDNESALAQQITDDIIEVGTIFFDFTPLVQKVLLVTWVDALQATADDPASGFADEVNANNTYQVAIALVSAEDLVGEVSRPLYTFAIFNYDQVQWTGWVAKNKTEYPVLAGMFYGDNKGLQSLPFARNDDEIKTYLPKKSSIVGISGRYIYDITNIPQRIGCINVLDFPASNDQPEILTTSVTTADIFGGTIVRLQGQCRPTEGYPPVRCGFEDVNENDESYWKTEIGVYLSNYTIVCLTPRLEMGRSKIGLSSPPPFKDYPFQADFYVNAPTADTALVQINNGFDKNFLEENAQGNITLTWNPELFDKDQRHRLEIFIEAFKLTDFSTIVTRTFKLYETPSDAGTYTFSISDTQCQATGSEDDDCDGFLIGYFNLRIKDFSDSPINPYTTKRVAISSIPIPIGWFVRSSHRARYGNSWYYRFCKTPAEPQESPKCPCSRSLAQYDTRQYTPAPDCQRSDRGARCLLQADNSYCYNGVTDQASGIRCCYNSNGDLIYGSDNPFVGSHKLTYFPFANFRTFGLSGVRTYLSYYLTHVKNHYACCSAQGLNSPKTSYCALFAKNAAVPTRCFDHQPSSITAIVGDPHFKLPDDQVFSFNGVGEFWYAYTSDEDLVKVQIRLGKATSKFATNFNKQVKATVLKAVALKYQNTVIQVQVQPLTYLNDDAANTKRLMIIINGREETWTNDEQVRFYDGFRIASSGENQDRFHVTHLDGGAMVACDYVDNAGDPEGPISPGAMNCRISYSQLQRNEIFGLIGLSNYGNFHLVHRDDSTVVANVTDKEEVHTIALSWQVKKNETFMRYIGSSWDRVNAETDSFEPDYDPSFIFGNETDEVRHCGDKNVDKYFSQCSYDFRLTGSSILAKQTKESLEETEGITNALNAAQSYCEALNLPLALADFSDGNKLNSTATITRCVRNYIPQGDVTFPLELTCTENPSGPGGVWTGSKVECVRGALYDTVSAKSLADPYKVATEADLGITGFSAIYLGRRVTNLRVSILTGCVVLLDSSDPSYEGLICPLVADHGKQPPVNVTDKFNFYYEVFNSNDLTGTLASISSDIREAAGKFDYSTSEYGVLNAYIFTWSDATFNGANCSTTEACDKQLRNTYQVVIAQGYNGKTYTIINYEKIEWSGIESPGSIPSNNSVAGFYYGGLKGVLPLPYSGSSTEQLKNLVKGGTLLSQPGRYIFEASNLQEPRRLGCYESAQGLRDSERLSISSNTFDIYGGSLIRVQGFCLAGNESCAFERRTSDGQLDWKIVPLRKIDSYTGLCVAPQLPDIDVGWRDIALVSGSDIRFQNRVYFGTGKNAGGISQLDFTSPAGEFWLWTRPNTTVNVQWTETFGLDDSQEPVPLHLYIRGYKSANESIDFGPIANTTSASNSIEFRTDDVQCSGDCEGVLIGQFVLKVDSDSLEDLYDKASIERISTTSVLMPIGWFTNSYHSQAHKDASWHNKFCDASSVPIAAGSLPQCPCTEDLAKTEDRLFFTTPDCLGFPSSINNCMFAPNAKNCYTTLPTKAGFSIRCCYDASGYLMQTQSTPLDGSYVLSDAVNSNADIFNLPGAKTQLSFQLSHVQNYFACCSVNILQEKLLTKTCTDLTYARGASRTCGGFRYSGWSAVVGDPHFVTLDGTKYTFNGIGEYWYLSSASLDSHIQVRFIQTINTTLAPANATTLKAIAFRFVDSVVEVHVQPPSFRRVGYNNRFLMILVNGKEQFWSTLNEQFHPRFKIDTDSNQQRVLVTAQDNGPLIDCQYVDADANKNFDGMNCRVSLPNAYKRLTNGLSGYWDDDSSNDLIARDSPVFAPIIADPTNMLAVHRNFSLSWRVRKSESFFTYFDESWETFNKDVDTFIPELNFPPNYNEVNQTQITTICGAAGKPNRDQCQYDMEITKSGTFAQKTLAFLNNIDANRANLDKLTVASCDYLDIPYATVTFPTGTVVGAVAQVVSCLPGYDKVVDVFPTFQCTQLGDNAPSWTPSPRTVCRGQEKLYADVIGAIPLNVSNPTLPDYTLPAMSTRATQGIAYNNRKIDGFTWLADIGCVALARNVPGSGSLKNLTDVRGSEIPLLCPLLASHANTMDADTSYQLLFKQLTYPSVSLSEMTRDIQDISEGLDTSLAQLEVTNAYVFAWKNARSANSNCTTAQACSNVVRNNYEVVLATTNLQTTYVLFSYQNITWTGFNEDGTAKNSYAGFHLGDNRGTEKLPFAGTDLNVIKGLTDLGTIRNFKGRYVYRVTDRIERLGCLELPAGTGLQSITMNTYIADIYGGRRLVLQANCPSANITNWGCLFSKNPFLPSGWTVRSPAQRLNAYSVVCTPPSLPNVEVGDYFIGLATSTAYTSQYNSKIYFSGTFSGTMPVRLINNLAWFSAVPNGPLRIEWSPEEFGYRTDNVEVILRTYKYTADNKFDDLEYKLGNEAASVGVFEFDPSDAVCDSTCDGRLIGQVIVRLVNQSSALLDYSLNNVQIASAIVPVGWYVNRWHVSNKGAGWYYNYCDVNPNKPSLTCPCTAAQAEDDYRTFTLAPNCNDVYGSDCIIASQADKCYISLPQTTNGSGLLCCYDRSDNLIYPQDQPFGGSYELQYAPTASSSLYDIDGAVAYLSYHNSHPKNLFACCSANLSNVASPQCYDYVESRSPTKKCTAYASSGVSAIIGDPHVLTPDATVYTFNGAGEFWWVYDKEGANKGVRIQARFRKDFKTSVEGTTQKEIRASLLTALAIKYRDVEIEIEVQSPAALAGGSRKLALYVQNIERQFSSLNVMYYQGARIASSATQESFQIITPFNGPSIECGYTEVYSSPTVGSMSCTILLPQTYKDNIYGLVGKWDGIGSNDLVNRANIAAGTPSANASDLSAVNDFGKTWKVLFDESWFDYYGTSFAEVNKVVDTFVPELTLNLTSTVLNQSEITLACTSNAQYRERCEYDYKVTNSRRLAQSTGTRLRGARGLQNALSTPVTNYCPQLDIPYAAKTYSNGLKQNSIATVAYCVSGYTLNPIRPRQYTCTKTGDVFDWSPTPLSTVCIKVADTTSTALPTSTETTGTNTTVIPTTVTTTGTKASSTANNIATSSSSSPANLSQDNTVEIILGVLMGVFVLITFILIIYYCVSIKPKLKVTASVNSGLEMGYSRAPQPATQKAAVEIPAQNNNLYGNTTEASDL